MKNEVMYDPDHSSKSERKKEMRWGQEQKVTHTQPNCFTCNLQLATKSNILFFQIVNKKIHE